MMCIIFSVEDNGPWGGIVMKKCGSSKALSDLLEVYKTLVDGGDGDARRIIRPEEVRAYREGFRDGVSESKKIVERLHDSPKR